MTPMANEFTSIVNNVVEDLNCLKWRIPDDFLSFDHFIRELRDVDPNSSPGYPYLLRKANNRQYLGMKNDGTFDLDRAYDLYESCLAYINCELSADPIRLFIKPEPISEKKFTNRAPRLISSVSIRDRMVDAMLFGEMNRTIVDKWPESPIKVGWSPVCGGWKMMSYLPQHAADRSNWDWTVKPWLLEACLAVRTSLCENVNSKWIDLARRRYFDLFNDPWFVTSGGLFLRQLQPGVQKSGCYNTITDNSIMQLLLHVFACYKLGLDRGVLIAVGDDTLQTPQPVEYYDFLRGHCMLKPVEEISEFCGFRFLPGGVVEPSHHDKHMFSVRYLGSREASSTSLSYSVVYHRSNRKNLVDGIFSSIGFVGIPNWRLDEIWDN